MHFSGASSRCFFRSGHWLRLALPHRRGSFWAFGGSGRLADGFQRRQIRRSRLSGLSGVQTLLKNVGGQAIQDSGTADVPASRIYGQGLLTQILNPKVSIFFIALLPQFVAPAGAHSPLPFLFLGALFVFMDTLWFLLLAAFSAFFTGWLRRSARFQYGLKWVTGSLDIGLGLNLLRVKAKFAS